MGPRRAITLDANAINNPNGHAFHEGPIFPDVGADGFWGDIIPPFGDLTPPDGFPGLNFTERGQEILANNCQIPGLVPPTSAPPETAPPGEEAAPPGAAAAPPGPVAAPRAPAAPAAPAAPRPPAVAVPAAPRGVTG